MNERRKGKIARLPKELREEVNQMLEDGVTYPKIVEHLSSQGHKDIQEKNISRWYQGGFQDWLKDQKQMEVMKVEAEFAQSVMAQNPECPVQEAGIKILGTQLFGMLSKFDLARVRAEMEEGDPKTYMELLKAFVLVNRRSLELEKFKAKVEKQRETLEQELSRGEGGIRPETLRRIEKELRLL
ncbi:phage protein Gp27 family protein [Pedosphaera parvula]|uniref:DUF3486 family protein n=1 Tax=Pedosphaera parvula (strain Ellin514) TaxID=320771 RepID=B9XP10_PEDPL|nr:phage protein Gp27 family protein [Pedosphaera parvula]EEF58476.1 hypothetical protein Cflav_PD1099 [Pedosphaera parvula Ellin514]